MLDRNPGYPPLLDGLVSFNARKGLSRRSQSSKDGDGRIKVWSERGIHERVYTLVFLAKQGVLGPATEETMPDRELLGAIFSPPPQVFLALLCFLVLGCVQQREYG